MCLFFINMNMRSASECFYSVWKSFLIHSLCLIIISLMWLFLNPFFKFNSIQDGSFRGCSWMGEAQKNSASLKSVKHIIQLWNLTWNTCTLPKEHKYIYIYIYIYIHIYIDRYINHVIKPLSSADISIFHWKSANFAIWRNTDIGYILIH